LGEASGNKREHRLVEGRNIPVKSASRAPIAFDA
jgi:hypothetical protein